MVDLSSTIAGEAVKFAVGVRPAATGSDSTAPQDGPRLSRGARVIESWVDHWAATLFQLVFAVAAIAFAVHPLITLTSMWRGGIAVLGGLALPVIPSVIAKSLTTLAPAAKMVAEVVRSVFPAGKGA